METPNFWTWTYLSAGIVSPLLAATKHDSLDPGRAKQKSAENLGGKTRRERRKSARKCRRETLSRVQVKGAQLFRTTAPPGFPRSQWRAGKKTLGLRFNSEGRTHALQTTGRGKNMIVISFKKNSHAGISLSDFYCPLMNPWALNRDRGVISVWRTDG